MSRWALILLVAGCVDSREVVCADGSICPTALACDLVHHTCVAADQLTSCAMLVDGDECPIAAGGTGICDQGVCLAQICGDGLVTGAEDCEGETDADCTALGFYDSKPLVCSARCQFDVTASACTGFCGDGVVNGPANAETCDGTPPPGGCIEYGFEAGRLACSAELCTPQFTSCRNFGFVRRPSGTSNVFALHALDAERVLLATQTGVVDTAGMIPPLTTTLPLYGVWASSPSDVHAVGFLGVAWHYDGTAWTKTRDEGVGGFYDVWGTSATNVLAVSNGSVVLRYDGSAWSVFEDGQRSEVWFSIWGWGPSDFVVVGSGGRIRRYTGTWTEQDTSGCFAGYPGGSTFYAVWGASPDDIHAVGVDGLACHFDGTTWRRRLTGTTATLSSVWGLGPNDVFAVGAEGTVVHYDGAEWRPVRSNSFSDFQAAGGTTNLVIAGTQGEVRDYTGTAVAIAEVPTVGGYLAAAPASGHEYFANYSLVHRWQHGQWTPVEYTATGWDSLWVSPDGVALAFDEATMHRFDGTSWTTSSLPFPVYGVVGTAENDLYAVHDQTAAVYHYDGVDWTEVIDVPSVTDLAVAGSTLFVLGSFDGTGVPVDVCTSGVCTTTQIPATAGMLPTSIYAATRDEAFVVGGGGAIFRFDGVTWTPMVSGIGTFLYDVAGTSGTDVWAGGAGGVLLHFDGVAWSPIAPLVDGDVGQIAVRSDRVLVSFDGGRETLALVRSVPW